MLDPHQPPPDCMRALFKKLQKRPAEGCSNTSDVLDPQMFSDNENCFLRVHRTLESALLTSVFDEFLRFTGSPTVLPASPYDRQILEVTALPGLFIVPSLLPAPVQVELLNVLLHRDLASPAHRTNLHVHYEIPYRSHHSSVTSSEAVSANSFFAANLDTMFAPKDAKIHKPLSMRQVMGKNLRWMTLGGQYDWTAKKYPLNAPPVFPHDIELLLRQLFPDTTAQAAIVNIYSPGDTLSVHRDVSEDCDRGLISISIGCEGIFIAGNEDGSQTATIRLRSGDALLMTGKSRYAWHAVPKILSGTCPGSLQSWPAPADRISEYEDWRGWLGAKRINLNVRQMQDG